MTDDIAAVRRVDQAINAGNELWRSFALRSGGSVVEISGDEGSIDLSAEHLLELPAVAQQYSGAVGATVSVGVGMKLSEGARALAVAKLRGGNQIVLWHPDMEAELAEQKPKGDEEKIWRDLNKADHKLGMLEGSHSGYQGHSIAHYQRKGQGDHEEAEVAKKTASESPAPEKSHSADHLEDQLHLEASKQHSADQQNSNNNDYAKDQLRAQLVQVLSTVKAKAPVLAQLQQVDPEAYQAVMALVQGVIALGREVTGGGDTNKEAPVQKAEKHHTDAPGTYADGAPCLYESAEECPDIDCTHHKKVEDEYSEAPNQGPQLGKSGGPISGMPPQAHLNLPDGSQVNGKIRVTHSDGKSSWVEVRDGMIQGKDPDSPLFGAQSHPVSSRSPSAR